ncbi:hypothetical protein LTR86_000682 [Recurvomyces mirabilis]|nr:hypothetical protein LTR86_000682 [Recurvomyces mirabilis]
MTDDAEYQKLERDPDASSEADLEDYVETPTTSQQRARSNWPAWIRILCEGILVAMVILLGLKVASGRGEGHPGPNDPRKQLGFTDTVFMNDTKFANEDALADPDALRTTLEHWVTLSSSMSFQ